MKKNCSAWHWRQAVLRTCMTTPSIFLCWFRALSTSGIPTRTLVPTSSSVSTLLVLASILRACRCWLVRAARRSRPAAPVLVQRAHRTPSGPVEEQGGWVCTVCPQTAHSPSSPSRVRTMRRRLLGPAMADPTSGDWDDRTDVPVWPAAATPSASSRSSSVSSSRRTEGGSLVSRRPRCGRQPNVASCGVRPIPSFTCSHA